MSFLASSPIRWPSFISLKTEEDCSSRSCALAAFFVALAAFASAFSSAFSSAFFAAFSAAASAFALTSALTAASSELFFPPSTTALFFMEVYCRSYSGMNVSLLSFLASSPIRWPSFISLKMEEDCSSRSCALAAFFVALAAFAAAASCSAAALAAAAVAAALALALASASSSAFSLAAFLAAFSSSSCSATTASTELDFFESLDDDDDDDDDAAAEASLLPRLAVLSDMLDPRTTASVASFFESFVARAFLASATSSFFSTDGGNCFWPVPLSTSSPAAEAVTVTAATGTVFFTRKCFGTVVTGTTVATGAITLVTAVGVESAAGTSLATTRPSSTVATSASSSPVVTTASGSGDGVTTNAGSGNVYPGAT